MKTFLLLLLLMTPNAVLAGHRNSTYQTKCYKDVYNETYVPGTMESPGYVRKDRRQVEIPCEYSSNRREYHQHNYRQQNKTNNVDENSCLEGSILGGIMGGGIGAAASRGDGRWWAIPLGIVGGSMVGCQIDGG